MHDFLESIRQSFQNLNERERKLVLALGVLLAVFVLGLPLMLMYNGNKELEDDNATLRALIDRIDERAVEYAQFARQRSADARRYQERAPSLGSFVEAEARKQGLSVREVNDQPEKSAGGYLRRSVNVSLPGVELTPTLNLMSGIVTSRYPVAIEQIQIEHYQPGDRFNVKLGLLTFDKQGQATKAAKNNGDEG